MKIIGLIVALAAAVAALIFRPHASEPVFLPATVTPRSHVRVAHAAGPIDVYVAGAVAKPGVYPISATARVIDALRVAGGARNDADLDSINLAAHVTDGEKIAVETHAARLERESRSAPRARKTASPKTPRVSRRTTKKHADSSAEPIDLNTASAEELAGLPGVGLGLAQRITDYRALYGGFDSLDDLTDIDGITARTIDAIVPYVVVR